MQKWTHIRDLIKVKRLYKFIPQNIDITHASEHFPDFKYENNNIKVSR